MESSELWVGSINHKLLITNKNLKDMRKVIITPALMEEGLGQLTTGEVIELFPRKCSFSGVGINEGFLVNGEAVAEDMVDLYCQSEFGKTWDKYLHTVGFGEFIPESERESYLEERGWDDFTDDMNHYTEWSLCNVGNGEDVYGAGGEVFEAVVLNHNDVMSIKQHINKLILLSYGYVIENYNIVDRMKDNQVILESSNESELEKCMEELTQDIYARNDTYDDIIQWRVDCIVKYLNLNTRDNIKFLRKTPYGTTRTVPGNVGSFDIDVFIQQVNHNTPQLFVNGVLVGDVKFK